MLVLISTNEYSQQHMFSWINKENVYLDTSFILAIRCLLMFCFVTRPLFKDYKKKLGALIICHNNDAFYKSIYLHDHGLKNRCLSSFEHHLKF